MHICNLLSIADVGLATVSNPSQIPNLNLKSLLRFRPLGEAVEKPNFPRLMENAQMQDFRNLEE